MSKSTLVLVHGAWQGSSAWSLVAPLLAEAGFNVVAVDLPGNGNDATPPEEVSLDLYAAHVGRIVAACEGPVFLVGHSGGATVAGQVAENMPEKIAGLILIAGIMLPDGMNFSEVTAELADEPGSGGVWPHLLWNEARDVCSVEEEGAIEIFYHDAPSDLARQAARGLVPQPLGGLVIAPRLTEERFGRVPRVYVEALQDRSVLLAAQRRMQALVPGAKVLSLDSGHAPLLSMPEAVARIVVDEVGAFQRAS
jgi:pimeloyl-ACP methyl ester carboxylesterase